MEDACEAEIVVKKIPRQTEITKKTVTHSLANRIVLKWRGAMRPSASLA